MSAPVQAHPPGPPRGPLHAVQTSARVGAGADADWLTLAARSTGPRPAGTARLVLVDDDDALRLALHELLVDAGYDVVGEAADGAQGLAVISEVSPDVVLLDLRMPGVGGVEVARQLRRHSPSVRVIMFSAYADLGLQSILSDLGVSAYLIKGCPYRRIVAAIESALAEHRRAS
ncbi:MAG: response regulator transcription factor [Candidatus Nanopelagicales bacterium]